jgi:fluoroquinolone transport system permease protein
MNPTLTIIQTDIKNILRDPSLLILLFVPLLIAAVLRWGYPILISEIPEISTYNMLVLALLSVSAAAMPGIAIAFAILDEKDNFLIDALRVLPVSFGDIIFYRNIAIYSFGSLAAFITISFSGISDGSIVQNIMLSFLAAAPAPLMALIPAFIAANKIEGATLAKAMNFIIVLPLPAFIFTGLWTWLLMIIPAWWIYQAFLNTANHIMFTVYFTAGIIIHLAAFAFLMEVVFRKRF